MGFKTILDTEIYRVTSMCFEDCLFSCGMQNLLIFMQSSVNMFIAGVYNSDLLIPSADGHSDDNAVELRTFSDKLFNVQMRNVNYVKSFIEQLEGVFVIFEVFRNVLYDVVFVFYFDF